MSLSTSPQHWSSEVALSRAAGAAKAYLFNNNTHTAGSGRGVSRWSGGRPADLALSWLTPAAAAAATPGSAAALVVPPDVAAAIAAVTTITGTTAAAAAAAGDGATAAAAAAGGGGGGSGSSCHLGAATGDTAVGRTGREDHTTGASLAINPAHGTSAAANVGTHTHDSGGTPHGGSHPTRKRRREGAAAAGAAGAGAAAAGGGAAVRVLRACSPADVSAALAAISAAGCYSKGSQALPHVPRKVATASMTRYTPKGCTGGVHVGATLHACTGLKDISSSKSSRSLSVSCRCVEVLFMLAQL